MPEISVIIPCYNQGVYLEEAMASVLKQTFEDWEIIIVNDGSTDRETIRILKELVFPKTKIFHTENKGLPAARNKGISEARGEFILPLDADDMIGATYLQQGIESFKNKPETKLVYCYGRYFEKNTSAIPRENGEFSYKSLLLYNSIFCSAIYRKTDFYNVGEYSINMRMGWEDWDLWIRLLSDGGQVFCIPEELFFYRMKNESMIETIKNDEQIQRKLQELLYINNSDIYSQYFGSPISVYREISLLRTERLNFESVKNAIYSSISYRLGHMILSPFKWMYKKVKAIK